MRPSGEKEIEQAGYRLVVGALRVDNLSRVLESRTSMTAPIPTAAKRPHGDQTARPTPEVAPTLVVHESHDAGIPDTILGMGEWMCWPYSFRTVDERGTSGSAE